MNTSPASLSHLIFHLNPWFSVGNWPAPDQLIIQLPGQGREGVPHPHRQTSHLHISGGGDPVLQNWDWDLTLTMTGIFGGDIKRLSQSKNWFWRILIPAFSSQQSSRLCLSFLNLAVRCDDTSAGSVCLWSIWSSAWQTSLGSSHRTTLTFGPQQQVNHNGSSDPCCKITNHFENQIGNFF